MRKYFMLFVIAGMLLTGLTNVQAQTKIKDNTVAETPLTPDSTAIMELESVHRGFLPPRMDSIQRNQIAAGNANALKDGMLIFNTDEQCVDYYDSTGTAETGQGQWISLCGSPLAQLSVDCGSITIPAADTPFVEGIALGTQYLQIPITVNTPGSYTIIATPTTPNGYSFSYSGTAAAQGTMLVNVPAQGTPINDETDVLNVLINNKSLDNCSNLTIRVLNTAATYTIVSSGAAASSNCGQNHFGGTYQAGTVMTAANTDTLYVNVTNISNGQNVWSITTNTVDGVYFSGSGVFTATGVQQVILKAVGTPASTQQSLKFSYNTNSPAMAGVACADSLKMALHAPSILFMNGTNSAYNIFYSGYTARQMFTNNLALFGSQAQAVCPVQGASNPAPATTATAMTGTGTTGISTFSATNKSTVASLPSGMSTVSDATLASTLPNAITAGTAPDIIWLTYLDYITGDAAALASYVKAGGVLIVNGMEGTSPNTGALFTAIYGNTVTSTGLTTTGASYPLVNTSFDAISGGPFGTFGAAGSGAQYSFWSEDGSATQYLLGLPASETDIYSNNVNTVNQSYITGSVTMYKSNQYNLFFAGDGGFTDPYTAGSRIAGSTNGTSAYGPVGYYTGGYGGTVPVNLSYNPGGVSSDNAALMCNIMAWAIQQAQFNGINSAKYK